MPDVELARRNGIELVRTGRFQTLTGSWNPTPADIKAAVEAMDCPAIRKPVIRIGHTDERFRISGDGEPALGWFENLRATDDGHTLVADQVTLPWLHSVQAAAYPSRSIEGNYNHLCSEGHRHPFVIHTVALLGITPPGVQTLRSLNDLPEMLGVAATGEVPEGAQRVEVTIMAADNTPGHTGAIIALVPTAEDAARLAVDGGEPAEALHLTLAYLGEAADLGARGQQDVIDAVSTAVNGLPLLQADVFSVNVFNPGDATGADPCLVWGLTGDMLDAVHDIIDDTLSLVDAAIPSQIRPWVAHITALDSGDLGRIAELAGKLGTVTFDRLRLAFADEFVDIPLMEWPGEEPDTVVGGDVSAAAGNPEALHAYWTTNPKGLAKWRDKPHPWTALFRQLSKYLNPDMAKRTASKWFIEVTGHTPNQGVKASDAPENPATEIPPATEPPPGAQQATEPALTLDPLPGIGDALLGALRDQIKRRSGAPILPAAEPEQPHQPEEDSVSLSDDMRSRLGLADDADEVAALAAIDELKAQAVRTPEPTPEMVAASAAATEMATKAEAEKDELRKEVTVLASQVETMSAKIADQEAEGRKTIKASVIDQAQQQGKFKPHEREQWEQDYDEAPGVTTRTLGRIAVGYAVPVLASGVTGPAEPAADPDGFSNEEAAAWAAQWNIPAEELTRG